MANKKQIYAEMFEQTAEQVTKSLSNWTGFLDVMGRLYKYPFHEQLMIYAQRTDATDDCGNAIMQFLYSNSYSCIIEI